MQRGTSPSGLALIIAMMAMLAGCGDAIETWRSANGLSKNDPDPQTALFVQNLAAGDAAPYPNLATVPPPPSRATTAAERRKLTEALVADRAATEAAARPLASATVPAARVTAPAEAAGLAAAAPTPDPAPSRLAATAP